MWPNQQGIEAIAVLLGRESGQQQQERKEELDVSDSMGMYQRRNQWHLGFFLFSFFSFSKTIFGALADTPNTPPTPLYPLKWARVWHENITFRAWKVSFPAMEED